MTTEHDGNPDGTSNGKPDNAPKREPREFDKRKTMKFERPVIRAAPADEPGDGAGAEEETGEFHPERGAESPAAPAKTDEAQDAAPPQPDPQEDEFDSRETGTFRAIEPDRE
jgi:hypothetical protein